MWFKSLFTWIDNVSWYRDVWVPENLSAYEKALEDKYRRNHPLKYKHMMQQRKPHQIETIESSGDEASE